MRSCTRYTKEQMEQRRQLGEWVFREVRLCLFTENEKVKWTALLPDMDLSCHRVCFKGANRQNEIIQVILPAY
jgi:hypothetical protein